jgi:hypothetical protein
MFQLVPRQSPSGPVPVVVTLIETVIVALGATVTLLAPLRVTELMVRAARADLGNSRARKLRVMKIKAVFISSYWSMSNYCNIYCWDIKDSCLAKYFGLLSLFY